MVATYIGHSLVYIEIIHYNWNVFINWWGNNLSAKKFCWFWKVQKLLHFKSNSNRFSFVHRVRTLLSYSYQHSLTCLNVLNPYHHFKEKLFQWLYNITESRICYHIYLIRLWFLTHISHHWLVKHMKRLKWTYVHHSSQFSTTTIDLCSCGP
jgi:hypothetical protein